MILGKFIQKWSAQMANAKQAIDHLRKHKEIKVKLIPVYTSADEFQDKKDEVQNLLSKILINAHKRGRPSKFDDEEVKYAA